MKFIILSVVSLLVFGEISVERAISQCTDGLSPFIPKDTDVDAAKTVCILASGDSKQVDKQIEAMKSMYEDLLSKAPAEVSESVKKLQGLFENLDTVQKNGNSEDVVMQLKSFLKEELPKIVGEDKVEEIETLINSLEENAGKMKDLMPTIMDEMKEMKNMDPKAMVQMVSEKIMQINDDMQWLEPEEMQSLLAEVQDFATEVMKSSLSLSPVAEYLEDDIKYWLAKFPEAKFDVTVLKKLASDDEKVQSALEKASKWDVTNDAEIKELDAMARDQIPIALESAALKKILCIQVLANGRDMEQVVDEVNALIAIKRVAEVLTTCNRSTSEVIAAETAAMAKRVSLLPKILRSKKKNTSLL